MSIDRPRSITYDVTDDGPGPAVNDLLLSTRSVYLVLTSRAVKTRLHAPSGALLRRFVLTVLRFNYQDYEAGRVRSNGRRMELRWHPRGRKVARERGRMSR